MPIWRIQSENNWGQTVAVLNRTISGMLIALALNNCALADDCQQTIDIDRGMCHWGRGEYDAGISYIESAGRSGNSAALTFLSKAYFFGDGVARDNQRALQLALAAFSNGAIGGAQWVAEIYQTGYGDFPASSAWLSVAAMEGNELAMLQLGDHYGDGIRVPKSSCLAAFWYGRSLGVIKEGRGGSLGIRQKWEKNKSDCSAETKASKSLRDKKR